MIDIIGLREDKRPQSSTIVHALLDRLEAAEKELAELRSSMKFRTSLIGRTEAERDDAKAAAENIALKLDYLRSKLETAKNAKNDWLRANAPGGWIDNLRIENEALRAKIERMERQGPVEWQTRTRPAWNDGTWGPWRKCSEEYAEDIKKTPLLHDWLYEARALYALPGAKALLRVPDAVMAALDSLDDYIARIEGNDRGACNHINLLRRYLLDAADVGENK